MLRTLSSSLHTCIAAAPRYTATRVAILDSSICSLTRTFGNANANGSKADFDKIVSIYRPEIKPEWQTLPKVLLDVRSDAEVAEESIPGNVHVRVDELPSLSKDEADELFKDKLALVYCKAGVRSAVGAGILKLRGYAATNLDGGINKYVAQGGKTQSSRT